MKSDIDCINGLLATEQYDVLQQLTEEFNLLELFDDVFGENSWSRILAFLFSSNERHKLGVAVFRAWLREVEREAKVSVLNLIPGNWKTEVKTEQITDKGRRIDILVKVHDPKNKLRAVFAIENKLDADEQKDQLKAYQQWIWSKYHDKVDILCLFFLTPDCREPETHDRKSGCKVLKCSYKTVSSALGSMMAKKDVQKLIESMIVYLDGQATMAKKAEELIEQLFKTPEHRHAIILICKHRPIARTVLDQVEKQLRNSKVLRGFRGSRALGIEFEPYRKIGTGDVPHLDINLEELKCVRDGITVSFSLTTFGWKRPEVGVSFALQSRSALR